MRRQRTVSEAGALGTRRRFLGWAAASAALASGVLPPLPARAKETAMDASGRVILITGATSGLGRRLAERLAAPGTTILVHGRDGRRGEEAVAAVRAAGGDGRFYPADLSSLAEVRGLADAILKDHARLDVLVNNAGIFNRPAEGPRELSRDGHELRFAINYLAPVVLTDRLVPRMKTGGPARIVNVTSAAQTAIDFDDLMLSRNYSDQRAYAQSKLALVMYTLDLAGDLKGGRVTANAVHPASYMDTPMVRDAGITPWSTVETGADAVMHLATSAALADRTGLYFDELREARANAQAYDAGARARLRALTAKLVAG